MGLLIFIRFNIRKAYTETFKDLSSTSLSLGPIAILAIVIGNMLYIRSITLICTVGVGGFKFHYVVIFLLLFHIEYKFISIKYIL